MPEDSKMLLLKWQGNNSKCYDGKINKKYLKNIMKRDRYKQLKVGDNMEVKVAFGQLYIVVQYPLKVDKKRKKKGLCFTLCSVVCM